MMNSRVRRQLSRGILGHAVVGCALLMLLAAGCNTAPPAADTKAAEDAVRAADAAWSKAAAAQDAAAVGSYYADDATVLPPNAPLITGKDAAQKSWAAMLVPGNSVSWTTEKVSSSTSGDMAYTQGAYTATMAGADGKPMSDTGKYLCVWKKQADGTWKSVEDVWNSDLPAGAPAAAAAPKKAAGKKKR
jgi:ketosteroid isomerase-like protein